MKIKLTELQRHKILTALKSASEVLNEIKQKTLKGEALTDMKILEQAVVNLEIFSIFK